MKPLLVVLAVVALLPYPLLARATEASAPTTAVGGEERGPVARPEDRPAAQLLPREDVAAPPAVAVPPAAPEKVKPRGYGQYEKVLIYDSSEGGRVESLPR